MRSQALAVSLVLLLIVVATLPGLSFSLSSSVTSQNNVIHYDTGGMSISGDNNPRVIKVGDEIFGNEAYEISSPSGSFGNGTVSLTIPSSKVFYICIGFDGANDEWFNQSKFDLTITGDKNDSSITIGNLNGVRLTTDTNGIKKGYLSYPVKDFLGRDTWGLAGDTTNVREFKSSGDKFLVKITGEEKAVTIHIYIIFIDNGGMVQP